MIDPLANRNIYVAGGIFPQVYHTDNEPPRKMFALVRPGHKAGDTLPYLWADMKNVAWITKHHAHVYRLDRDADTLDLVIKSWEAEPNVEAPLHVKLGGEQLVLLRAALARGKFVDEE